MDAAGRISRCCDVTASARLDASGLNFVPLHVGSLHDDIMVQCGPTRYISVTRIVHFSRTLTTIQRGTPFTKISISTPSFQSRQCYANALEALRAGRGRVLAEHGCSSADRCDYGGRMLHNRYSLVVLQDVVDVDHLPVPIQTACTASRYGTFGSW